MNRRKFMQFASLATAGSFLPSMSVANNAIGQNKIVVLVHLKGANDGFNSLVHFNDDDYYNHRGNIALKKENRIILLNDEVGMHPNLKKLEPLWKEGDMAWVEGVGYPKTILSHPRSLEVWEHAHPKERQRGWLSHVLPRYKKGLHGIVFDKDIASGAVLTGSGMNAITMANPRSFLGMVRGLEDVNINGVNPAIAHISKVQHYTYEMGKQIEEKMIKSGSFANHGFKGTEVGRSLQSVAKMILSGIDAPVYKVTQSGFDSHAGQLAMQGSALHQLADGISSFATALKRGGVWDNVVVVTYSEFGRRIGVNRSGGTDHGTASAQMIFGGRVKGGLYGKHPNLKRLDGNGNVYHTTDFRAIYGELAQRWWGQPNPWRVHRILRFLG